MAHIVRPGKLRLHPRARPASVRRVIRPVDVLLEFLSAESARGVTHVLLDQETREALRELSQRSKSPRAAHAAVAAAAPVFQALVEETPPPAAVAPVKLEIHGDSRADKLSALRRQSENWAPAKRLGSLRDAMVFGIGSPSARVMFIGEAPGYPEEKALEPFVGEAGKKLDEIFKAMGILRQDVYLTFLVKFRPSMPRQATNNRKPTAEEIEACLPLLRAEIEIVQPACIVALGETTAEGLLGVSATVPTLRGIWHDLAGIPVRVTYPPGYLLQTTTNLTAKRQVWEDMLALMERLELPISAKQRGYFLPKP